MINKVYVGGDMLKEGSRILRALENNQIRVLGYHTYNPKDNDEINDKQNQTEESNNSLAEKIVLQDTKGLIDCDTIVIEPTNDACGTMVELGQLKGMRDIAKLLKDKSEGERDYIIYKILNKLIYPHYEDCRRTDLPEVGDRRSFSVNQYVYGTCLDLTEGKGFYSWNEILDILKKRKKSEECDINYILKGIQDSEDENKQYDLLARGYYNNEIFLNFLDRTINADCIENLLKNNLEKLEKLKSIILQYKYVPDNAVIFKHFKGKLYQYVSTATTKDKIMVIYKALYGKGKIYARELSMFLSEVDKNKYPEVTQKYRFEPISIHGTNEY